MGQIYTAADIRRLAREETRRDLILAEQDRITPEALDVARQIGMQVHREGQAPGIGGHPPRAGERSERDRPIAVVRLGEVREEPFAFDVGRPDMNIRCTDVVNAMHGSPMAAGVMSWDAGFFPWTLDYDEIDLVLDGRLEIRHAGRSIQAGPGDVVYIPKGSEIEFGSTSAVRVFYVTYPAGWGIR
jgi:ethanolamine utilization protein EutQ